MKNQIKLLKILEKHGLETRFNVSPFMTKYFEKPTSSTTDLLYTGENDKIAKKFLTDLLDRKYLIFDREKLEIEFTYMGKTFEPQEIWFDNTDFYVKITLAGLEYLNSLRLTKSSIRNYKSQKLAFKSQKKASRTTNIIAGLTTVITLVTLGFTVYQTIMLNQVDKELIPLKARLKVIESKLYGSKHLPKTETDFSHTLSPSSLDTLQTTYSENKKAPTKVAYVKKYLFFGWFAFIQRITYHVV